MMKEKVKTDPRKPHKGGGIPFVDLFAGCGGLSLGLEQAGFEPCFVNEIVPTYVGSYIRNHDLPKERYYIGDIHKLLEDFDQVHKYFADARMVCGGPPCQGFSMANRQRIIDDPRNHLYKAFVEFLSRVRPEVFIMENVKGMLSRVDEIQADFTRNLGNDYQFAFKLLNAADFGVPQSRQRLVCIGNRIGVAPEEIFEKILAGRYPQFVLGDALEGLPHLGARKEKNKGDYESEECGLTERPFKYPDTEFYHFLNGRRLIHTLYNHKNRYNNERDIEIYTRLPQGGNSLHPSIADIMPYKRRNDIFKDKYFKLEEDKVCKTITSHMRFDCNMYIHPWEARGLSPREAARIQTFPDDYVFTGPQNSWYAQIGNAVPVKMAYAIAKGVISYL